MTALQTLQDLTGQESGIIVYEGNTARVVNWSSIYGIPYQFGTDTIGYPQEIPEVSGERVDSLSDLLDGVDLDRGTLPDDEDMPESGTVYRLNDHITVIAPDDWC